MKSIVFTVILLALACGQPAQCGIVLEGFDDFGALAGRGWITRNNSEPVGATSWFQGAPSAFAAETGAPSAYVAANFNNTGSTGTISNWLITPHYIFADGDSMTFSTRTVAPSIFPDRLEVRFSSAGASGDVGSTSSSVGDFTTLLFEINPDLTTSGYPNGWTQYTVSLAGLPGNTGGRFAFRYHVTDAGVVGKNSDYIGIDSVKLEVASVPEPITLVITGAGLLVLYARVRRRRR